jgi:signal transduction histidine kinase
LSIVKHIIESHQSKINVESSSKKGTKFWFQLKASPALKSEIITAASTI